LIVLRNGLVVSYFQEQVLAFFLNQIFVIMNRFSLLPLISAGLALLFLAAIPIVFSAEDGVVKHAPITSCVATDTENGTCCPEPEAHCVIATSGDPIIIPNTQWITGGDPCP